MNRGNLTVTKSDKINAIRSLIISYHLVLNRVKIQKILLRRDQIFKRLHIEIGYLAALFYINLKNNYMAQVKSGDKIKVHYHGKLTNGETFDSSEGREPLEFEVGSGMVIQRI